MKQKLGLFLIFSSCLYLLGCGSGGSSTGTGTGTGTGIGNSPPSTTVVDNLGTGDMLGNESFQASNNSALLFGPTFGSNSDANVVLRKGVPFELIGDAGDIVAEHVVIVREENNPSAPFVVAYIRNNSDSTRCGIVFDDIELVHKNAETFPVVPHFFTSGGVNDRSNSSGGTAQSCLPARGTGYHVIAGSGQGLYDEVEKVRFSIKDGINITGEIQLLPGTVRPVAYEVETAPNGKITLSVSVQNNLARTIFIAAPHVFALDENGQVIMYSAATPESTIEAFTIAAGETKVVTVIMYLSGQASSIRASVFFVYPL